MTVKELKMELECYDDDQEIEFKIDDEFEPESITEDRYGWRNVHLSSELKITFSGDVAGKCYFEMGVLK